MVVQSTEDDVSQLQMHMVLLYFAVNYNLRCFVTNNLQRSQLVSRQLACALIALHCNLVLPAGNQKYQDLSSVRCSAATENGSNALCTECAAPGVIPSKIKSNAFMPYWSYVDHIPCSNLL